MDDGRVESITLEVVTTFAAAPCHPSYLQLPWRIRGVCFTKAELDFAAIYVCELGLRVKNNLFGSYPLLPK